MSTLSRDAIKQFFETGDTPSAQQFALLIEAMLNLSDDDLHPQAGNLGLGTSPKNKLDVAGNLAIGTSLAGQALAPLNGLKVEGLSELLGGWALPQGPTIHAISNDAESPDGASDTLMTEAAIKQLVSALDTRWQQQTCGQVAAFARPTPPQGWLICNGQAIRRDQYPLLFEAIGTTWGAGDGATTFNLPDLRGEFIRGWDQGRGVDNGRPFGSWQNHMFQSHQHHVLTRQDDYNVSGGDGPSFGADNGSYIPRHPTNHQGGHETRPRNLALLYCIKY